MNPIWCTLRLLILLQSTNHHTPPHITTHHTPPHITHTPHPHTTTHHPHTTHPIPLSLLSRMQPSPVLQLFYSFHIYTFPLFHIFGRLNLMQWLLHHQNLIFFPPITLASKFSQKVLQMLYIKSLSIPNHEILPRWTRTIRTMNISLVILPAVWFLFLSLIDILLLHSLLS